ncbi:hypothetical protein M422DRAFT_56115 [Sphaerobolus stellatus SS14]|uniref:Uncharacterized protein n=1 Tax=Sphaerobolus stellatus (strain SS14) TaxID=990650 RepID=A0A0C9T7Z4_SPHS4|nr:hypothetical protein M422DRAFT_56115 [Sphaerobolus stellatus SS14]
MVYDYPLGTIVEYPPAGEEATDIIAHRFAIEPNADLKQSHPKQIFQYSLGGRDYSWTEIWPLDGFSHQQHCNMQSHMCSIHLFHNAEKEVFMKTLALYAVLHEKGCPYEREVEDAVEDPYDSGEISEGSDDDEIIDGDRVRDVRATTLGRTCQGNLLLHTTSAGKPIIRYSHSDSIFLC